MTTIGTLVRAALDHWVVVLAILINLALAAPAAAGWDNEACYYQGEVIPCCESCLFFCSCDLIE